MLLRKTFCRAHYLLLDDAAYRAPFGLSTFSQNIRIGKKCSDGKNTPAYFGAMTDAKFHVIEATSFSFILSKFVNE